VLVWDVHEGQLAGNYEGHWQSAGSVAISRIGREVSADDGGMVRLWNPATLTTYWENSLAPAADPYWLAFSPDGRRLYAPSRTDTLTVLDAATGRRLHSVSGLGDVLDGVAVSPDGRWIALCRKTGLIVLEAEDLSESWSTRGLPDRCAAFSPDGKWIATGDTDGAVSLYDVGSATRTGQ
jgi:WD40 repeat protein